MPFDQTRGIKSKAHPRYKTQCRVARWRSCDRTLVRRANVTLWLAPETSLPGTCGDSQAQKVRQHSDLPIATGQMLQLIFKFPIRQVGGFLHSVVAMIGLVLSAPDHTTLSTRGQPLDLSFVACQPAKAFISSSTAQNHRLWVKVNGPPRNTVDAASRIGRRLT